MILDVGRDAVNSTQIEHVDEDSEPLLSAGAIAAITICTTFVFYLTIMFIVCVGEYCQYINGKKEKVGIRRHTQSMPQQTDAHIGRQWVQTYGHPEINLTQSGETPTSISQSESRDGMGDGQLFFSAPTIDPDPDCVDRHSGIVQVHIEDRLSQLEPDCVDTCDSPYMNSDPEISMVPLMIRQCEDILEPEVEILCDSADSRDMYRLEADV